LLFYCCFAKCQHAVSHGTNLVDCHNYNLAKEYFYKLIVSEKMTNSERIVSL
jgi:hypothetical protein